MIESAELDAFLNQLDDKENCFVETLDKLGDTYNEIKDFYTKEGKKIVEEATKKENVLRQHSLSFDKSERTFENILRGKTSSSKYKIELDRQVAQCTKKIGARVQDYHQKNNSVRELYDMFESTKSLEVKEEKLNQLND